jgi:replication-associated recombination protein RarA
MYQEIIEKFNDIIDVNHTFNSISFNVALQQIETGENRLKFLLGVPGSGKTFLINFLEKKWKEKRILLLQAPLTLDELKDRIKKELISHQTDFIIIDEAQLLDELSLEYVRVITDNYEIEIMLSMHLKEGKKLLEKEHFKSRNIDIIELKMLTKKEMIQFINVELIKHNTNHIFTDREFDIIYNYTNGNFRYIKKFIRTLFELLEFAHTKHLTKYQKPNRCLLIMTALELGLEND